MSKFKIGDRVRLVTNGGFPSTCRAGDYGTVSKAYDRGVDVRLDVWRDEEDDEPIPLFFDFHEVEPISSKFQVGDLATVVYSLGAPYEVGTLVRIVGVLGSDGCETGGRYAVTLAVPTGQPRFDDRYIARDSSLRRYTGAEPAPETKPEAPAVDTEALIETLVRIFENSSDPWAVRQAALVLANCDELPA